MQYTRQNTHQCDFAKQTASTVRESSIDEDKVKKEQNKS
jgi:hypothetical protein